MKGILAEKRQCDWVFGVSGVMSEVLGDVGGAPARRSRVMARFRRTSMHQVAAEPGRQLVGAGLGGVREQDHRAIGAGDPGWRRCPPTRRRARSDAPELIGRSVEIEGPTAMRVADRRHHVT
jgi:hypothetical protein